MAPLDNNEWDFGQDVIVIIFVFLLSFCPYVLFVYPLYCSRSHTSWSQTIVPIPYTAIQFSLVEAFACC